MRTTTQRQIERSSYGYNPEFVEGVWAKRRKAELREMRELAHRLFLNGSDTLGVAKIMKISEAQAVQLIDQARNEKIEKGKQ